MLFLITVILAAVSLSEVEGIRCYVCTSVDKPEDCYHIGECAADQKCHVRKYTNTLGYSVYDLGCQATAFCDFVTNFRRDEGNKRQSDAVKWHGCCNDTDFCNIYYDADGNTTSPDRLRCFNCDYVHDPAECDSVITCEEGDLCEKIVPHMTLGHHHHSRSLELELCQGCCNVTSLCNGYFCSETFNDTSIPAITGTTAPTTTMITTLVPITTMITTAVPISSVKVATLVPPSLSITQGPTNQTVYPGSTVVFDCEASGPPSVSIMWMFTHAHKSSVNVIISGVTTTSTGSQLTIHNVTENDLGNYVCLAQANSKTVTAAAELTFKEYLNITQGPTSVHMTHGSSAAFTCDVIGYPPPTITWLFTHIANGRLSVLTSGVTLTSSGSSLTIDNVSDGDLGTYVCFANNTVGTQQEIAKLEDKALVPPSLSITQGPTNQTVDPGSTVVFDCEASGPPSLNIIWMFTHAHESNVNVIISGVTTTSTGSQLTIHNVTENDLGNYVCLTQANSKTVTAAAELTFKEYLNITQGPTSVSVSHDGSATFTCDVIGYPRPTITWLFTHILNGRLSVLTTGVTSTATGSKLTIDKVSDGDLGTYVCFANNTVGTQQETAKLEDKVSALVPPSLSITQGPTNQTVDPCSTVVFDCEASGPSSLNIVWIFTHTHQSTVNIVTTGVTTTTTGSQLTIHNVSENDLGNYVCLTTAGSEKLTAAAELTFKEYLNVTQGPASISVTHGGSATFTCDVIGYPPPTITWFFTHSLNGLLSVLTTGVTSTSTGSKLTIGNVSDGDVGIYVCFANNTAGTHRDIAELVTGAVVPTFLNITQGPTNQTVDPGSTVVFDCEANGYPSLNITWMFTHAHQSTVNVITTGVTTTPTGSQLTIHNVTENDLGHYVCFTATSSETLSAAAELSLNAVVPSFLNITQGPTNQTVDPGSTVVFDCEANGYPSLNITWMFTHAHQSTVNIITTGVTTTPTGSQLTIHNVTENDLGHYVCFTATSSETLSAAAELTFKEYLNVTQGPASINATHGGSATFTCDVIGYPPPTITWFFTHSLNGLLSVLTTGVTSTSTGSKLTIDSVSDGDVGTYVCFANNTAGTNRDIAELVTEAKFPSFLNITQGPTNQTVYPGSTVVFDCEVNGYPSLNITWMFTHTNKATVDVITTGVTTIPTGSQLTIHNVTENDVGHYACFTATSSETLSAAAELTFREYLNITQGPSSISVTQGGSATFTCDVIGYPHPTITWFFTQNLNGRLSVLTTGTTTTSAGSKLTIDKVSDGELGTYVCFAKNTAGIQQDVAELVYGAMLPSFLNITQGPTDQAVYPGSTAVFDCEASGYPSLNITWMFTHAQKSTVDVITSSVTTTSTGSQLTIHNVTENDLGHYVCVMLTSSKTLTAGAELTFEEYLNITQGPTSVGVTHGGSATFTCDVIGYPPPTITWFFTHIKNGRLSVLTIGVTTTATGSKLTIDKVSDGDLGTYVCAAENSAGKQQDIAHLVYGGTPMITLPPKSQKVTLGDRVDLTCEATGDPKPKLHWSFISTNTGSTFMPPGVSVSLRKDHLTVFHMGSEHAGNYACIATNTAGTDTATAIITV